MNKIRLQEIQGILSVGYIYLIVMGILNETLYYNQIGIDILSYSNLVDVLLSPISRLTSNTFLLIVFVLMVFLLFYFPKYFVKNKNKIWVRKGFSYRYELDDQEAENFYFKRFTFIFCLGLLGFFVGTGLGGGLKTVKEIKNNKIEYNDVLYFINGDTSKVEILGKNSAYIFYLSPENKAVIVAPITGIIKNIEENK